MSIVNSSTHTRRDILKTASLGIAAAALGFPAIARAASLDDIKKRGKLLVVCEDDFQPFEFYKDNVLTGYDVDLLKAITPKLPFPVDEQVIPWTGILPGVTTGKYDMAATAVLVTKERLGSLAMTSPTAESVNYYLKRKSDTSITGIKDLNGKKIGVEAGSAMLAQLPQLDAMLAKTGGKMGPVTQYQGYPEAYQDLASGRIDAVINTFLSVQSTAQQKPNVFAVGQAVSAPSYIAWAIAKESTELLGVINTALLAARKDGTMYALQKKWFNVTFEKMPEQPTAA